jgi:hypothetical protein
MLGVESSPVTGVRTGATAPDLRGAAWGADMVKARTFFFVCAGLLCLALSYHLGARNAAAQAPENPVVGLAAGVSGPG